MGTIIEKKACGVKKRGEAAPLSDETDEALLLRYRDFGEVGAFEELVHRYETELYSYLRRYLGDESLAEDAFQAAFLQLHTKCDQFDQARKVRPWLYTIATNQAIDAQRRSRRHRMVSLDHRDERSTDETASALIDLLASRDSGPPEELEAHERRNWIRQAVAQLPESLRSAVNLIYYQGLKYREAAAILDIPVGTVKSRLHTAILKLNEAWSHAGLSGND